MEKQRISMPIIVEGKYDKNKIKQVFDADVISVGGFGIFNSSELRALLRRISVGGVILLTDSDGGGVQIRKYLKGILPEGKVYNAYIPKIEGKERRKTAPSKAGLLGVEGMSAEVIREVLAPFVENGERATNLCKNSDEMLTKVDFYKDGLTGAENSSARRDALARMFDLPSGMSAGALLAAVNIITDRQGYEEAVGKLDPK